MATFCTEGNGDGINKIPTSQQMYKPILLRLAIAGVSSNKEIYDYIFSYFKLKEEDLLLTTENGRTPLFYVRMNYALLTLNNRCLIKRLSKGLYNCTFLGTWLLGQYSNNELIDITWIPNFLLDRYGHHCPDIIAEERCGTFMKSLGLYYDGEGECSIQKYQDRGYLLSIEELFDIYKSDGELRNLLKIGRFTYIKGYLATVHLRINKKEYGHTLVWTSRDNEECYLGFVKNKHTGLISYSGLISHLSEKRGQYRVSYYATGDFVHPWGEFDDPYTRMRVDSWIASMPEEAHEALIYLMKECKVKRGHLADMLEVTPRTILRWISGETPMKLESLIAICLALQLPPKMSFILINKFNARDAEGVCFQPDINEKHLFWEMLLDTFHMSRPKELNQICKKKGYDIFFTEDLSVYNGHPRHEYIRSK